MAKDGRTDRSRRRNHSQMPLSIGIAMQLSRIPWLQGHLSSVRYRPDRTALLGRFVRLLTRLLCSVTDTPRSSSLWARATWTDKKTQKTSSACWNSFTTSSNAWTSGPALFASSMYVRILAIRTITKSINRFYNAFFSDRRPPNKQIMYEVRYMVSFHHGPLSFSDRPLYLTQPPSIHSSITSWSRCTF
jgi:hypothetical protein